MEERTNTKEYVQREEKLERIKLALERNEQAVYNYRKDKLDNRKLMG